jgi:DNA-binding transcriptional regulator YiaG
MSGEYSSGARQPAQASLRSWGMHPYKRGLHSPDPRDLFRDPLDQANAIDEMDPFNPEDAIPDVRALRERMRLTQRAFAGLFGFPVATLRHWERGNRTPAGTALVLLHVIRENPRVVLQAVRRARLRDPGGLAAIEPHKTSRAPPGFGYRSPPLRPTGPRRPR